MITIEDLQPGQAMLVDWTASEYHADTATTSNSQLTCLRDAGPSLYHARHESRTIPPDNETRATQLGTNIHLAVLEPAEMMRRMYPPKPDKPGGANGSARKGSTARVMYETWTRACDVWRSCIKPETIVLTAADLAKIPKIVHAIQGHPQAKSMLDSPGVCEQTVVWREPETGLLVRVRLDRLCFIGDHTVVINDLKTTRDAPTEYAFGMAIDKYGYHRQGAIYTDAVQALYPDRTIHFVITAVHSVETYEVATYRLEPDDEIDRGRKQYMHSMRDIVRRRAADDWSAPWQTGLRKAETPRWVKETT